MDQHRSPSIRRPGTITAIAIMNLVYAIGLAIACTLFLTTMPGILRDLDPKSGPSIGGDLDAHLRSTTDMLRVVFTPLVIAMCIFSLVLAVASIDLLRMRQWARHATLAASWVTVAFSVVMVITNLTQRRWEKSLDFMPLMYWILVIALLMSRDIKAAFNNAAALRAAARTDSHADSIAPPVPAA